MKGFKLKKIDWYIIKQFLGTYIFAIALIISISVVFDINEKIDKFLRPEVPLQAIIFDYYLNFIPYFANLFSPLFTFIAVIFFTSKLADHSEIIAMLASGMSFRRLMLPYAISAGIIAIASFILSAFIIPPANETRINFQNKYIKNKAVEPLHAPVEPAFGQAKGFLGIFIIGIARATLVERHDDVGTDGTLDVHYLLWCKEVLRTVDMRAELGALFMQFAVIGEGKDLEPSAIGEDRAFPPIELMQSAHLFQYL